MNRIAVAAVVLAALAAPVLADAPAATVTQTVAIPPEVIGIMASSSITFDKTFGMHPEI